MRALTLPLNAEYFDAIRDGLKVEEYRLKTDYWRTRLVGRVYDRVVLTKGYPKADDVTRRLILPWKGFTEKVILHKHFGPLPVFVYAIDVSR